VVTIFGENWKVQCCVVMKSIITEILGALANTRLLVKELELVERVRKSHIRKLGLALESH
jgi:hypothetical protein